MIDYMKTLETKNITFLSEEKGWDDFLWYRFSISYHFKKYEFIVAYAEFGESIAFHLRVNRNLPIKLLSILEKFYKKLESDIPKLPEFRLRKVVENVEFKFEAPGMNSYLENKASSDMFGKIPSIILISFFVCFSILFSFELMRVLSNMIVPGYFDYLADYKGELNGKQILFFLCDLVFFVGVFLLIFYSNFSRIDRWTENIDRKTANYLFSRFKKKYPYFIKK
jgi:hypothetical protein